jgi:hypothetical protein
VSCITSRERDRPCSAGCRGPRTSRPACFLPAKARCTTSDHGRKVQRSIFIDYVEKVRSYHATEPYKKAIRKRQAWVEPLFAEAKEWHSLRRLRLRGLLNANIQGLLIAAGQNMKRCMLEVGGADVMLPVEASWPFQRRHAGSRPSAGNDLLGRNARWCGWAICGLRERAPLSQALVSTA